uniref:Uncharacterized protein n=1 Tax=Amphimedon queenslandica TaxID=400682 RepID=A0A1X7VDX8_AMPQE
MNSCKKLVPRNETLVHYYPVIGETGLLTGLHPNTLYNCSAQLQTGSRKHEPSQSFTVQTGIGAPERPLKPNIRKKDDNALIIKVYNSSTCNGPISGYELQFHVADTISLDKDNLPLIPEDQLKPLSGNLASLEEAKNNKKASSFYIRERVIHDITINTRSLMSGALKVNSTYVVITSVYTRVQDQELLYSYSLPSDPITFKTDELPTKESDTNDDESFSERYGQRLLYVIAGASPFGVILCMFALICLIWRIRSNRLKNKRNKMYMYEPLKTNTTNRPFIDQCTTNRPFIDQCTTNRPFIDQCITTKPLIGQCTTHRPFIDRYIISKSFIDQCATSRSFFDQCIISRSFVDQCIISRSFVDQCITSKPFFYQCTTSKSFGD